MWSGWTVHADETKAGRRSTRVYYARVSDRADAVESVKQHIGATSYPIVLEARKPIQSTVFAAMGIACGEVRSIAPA